MDSLLGWEIQAGCEDSKQGSTGTLLASCRASAHSRRLWLSTRLAEIKKSPEDAAKEEVTRSEISKSRRALVLYVSKLYGIVL